MLTPEQFFEGSPIGLTLYKAVADTISSIGPAEVRVTKSQIAFKARKGFACVWRPRLVPGDRLPAVLSFALPQELHSPRFKKVAHPAPRVWMRHIELWHRRQIDAEGPGLA
jgi:hypothetical protein